MRESDFLIQEAPVTRRQFNISFLVALSIFTIWCICLPFRNDQFPNSAAATFFDTAELSVYLITATVLFALGLAQRSNALAALATGYVVAGLFVILHVICISERPGWGALLSVPSNTTAWFYLIRQAAIPLGAIGYCRLQNSTTASGSFSSPPNGAIFLCVGLFVLVALALAALMKVGGGVLPQLVIGPATWSVARTQFVTFPLIALTTISMMLLWSKRKSVLVMGLTLTLSSRILELAFVTTFDTRFSVAWYALRAIGLISASFLFVMLLSKATLGEVVRCGRVARGGGITKSVSQSAEELREEVAKAKQLAARMKKNADPAAQVGVEIVQRRISDAEEILARWDTADETLSSDIYLRSD